MFEAYFYTVNHISFLCLLLISHHEYGNFLQFWLRPFVQRAAVAAQPNGLALHFWAFQTKCMHRFEHVNPTFVHVKWCVIKKQILKKQYHVSSRFCFFLSLYRMLWVHARWANVCKTKCHVASSIFWRKKNEWINESAYLQMKI